MSLLSQSPTDEKKLDRARERLQALLRESDLYRVQFLLGETHLSEDDVLSVNVHECFVAASQPDVLY